MFGRRRNKSEEQATPVEPVVDERERLRQHIERESGFRVTTVDGLNWICPYTLALVPAPFDVATTACDSLLERKPWTSAKPRPIGEILTARWSHFLRERWELEPRLHLHGPDGQWLNPWTGTWVPIPAGAAPAELITLRARHLALQPQNELGALLEMPQLEAILRKRAPAAPAPVVRAPAQNATPAPSSTGTWQRPPPVGAANASVSTPLGQAVVASRPAAPSTTPSSGMIDRAALGDPIRARAVLNRMLPPLPSLPGYRMAVRFEPVQGIGGDFYDVIALPEGRWLILIGDVSGHGAEAALIVASALKAVRLLAPTVPDPIELLIKLNDTMRPDLPAGTFITMWAGVLEPETRTLTHVCAGHHPALLLSMRRGETLQQVGQSGMALGMASGAQLRTRLKLGRLQLQPGDVLVQFTDGMFDVSNGKGDEFGRLRVMGGCVANLEQTPEDLASQLVADVKAFTGGAIDDDLTLLVLSVEPA